MVKITDSTGRKPVLNQWDVDRVLLITGTSTAPILHFARMELSRALTVVAEPTATEGTYKCKIPNFVLQFAGGLVISVFEQDEEGQTVLNLPVFVQPKLKPQDYTYEENIGYVNWVQMSEEAQKILDNLDKVLAEAAKSAETAEEAAKAVEKAVESFDTSHLKNVEISEDGDTATFTHENGSKTIFEQKHHTFIAEYGKTTFQEIVDAAMAGKEVVCIYYLTSSKNYRRTYNLDYISNSTNDKNAYFSLYYQSKHYSVKCNGANVWTELDTVTFQTTENRVDTIDDKSTTTQYPSAKGVYDLTKPMADDIDKLTDAVSQTVETNITKERWDRGYISETGEQVDSVYYARTYALSEMVADGDKVKVSITGDIATRFLYVAVFSGDGVFKRHIEKYPKNRPADSRQEVVFTAAADEQYCLVVGRENAMVIKDIPESVSVEIASMNPPKRAEIDNLRSEVANHDTRITALEEEPKVPQTLVEQVEANRKNLEHLWKLNQGISYDFETDDAAAYSKPIPSGALEMDVKRIGGKSIVWNQMYNGFRMAFDGASKADGRVITYTCSGTSTANRNILQLLATGSSNSHKVLARVRIENRTSYARVFRFAIKTGDFTNAINIPAESSAWLKGINDYTYEYGIRIQTETAMEAGDAFTFSDFNAYDLTAMFGAGNEPTAEEFEAMLTADYYPYSEPTIVSADVDEVMVRGRNLLTTNNCSVGFTNTAYHNLSYVKNADDSVTVKGTIKNTTASTMYVNVRFIPTEELIIEAGTYKTSKGTTVAFPSGNKAGTFTLDSAMKVSNWYHFFMIAAGATLEVNETIRTALVHDGSTTDYAPYHEPVAIPVPAAIRNLEGYGWSVGDVYNELDFERKVFVKRVGKAKFGDTPRNLWYVYSGFVHTVGFPPMVSIGSVKSGLCAKYPVLGNWNTCDVVDSWYINNPGQIVVTDLSLDASTYNGLTEFRKAIADAEFYYEMAEPVEIDISEYLDAEFENIEAESGGSITFHQSAGICLPVPNSEEYLIALNEVTA